MSFAIGVSGGTGGRTFSERAADTVVGGRYDEWINKLFFRSADFVDGIQIGFRAINGTEWASVHHGGTGGRDGTFTIIDGEYITAVWGNFGGLRGSQVNYMTIRTNRNREEQFGAYHGSTGFSFELPPGYEVCGFFGASGTYLDNIGVYYRKHLDISIPQSGPGHF